MKKLVTTLTTLALATSVAMADKSLDASMINMETGLSDIQKGFLYNQKALINEGAKKILDGNKIFHSESSVKKYLPANKSHMSGIAFNTANRINQYTDELTVYLKNNEYSKASSAYSNIINACTNCHAIVRGW
jgi:cytochrome c553